MRVFISYRRDDAPDATDRLTAALVERLGRDNVFMDVDSIDIGADFATVIGNWVQRCDVVLAVIGRDWLDARNSQGGRRLDNPDDYVRLEIEAGLSRGVRVVPVLLQGGQLPGPGTLPESLEPLLQRNAIELTRKHWELDVQDLLLALERFAKDRAEQFAEERGRWEAIAEPPSPGNDVATPIGAEQSGEAGAGTRRGRLTTRRSDATVGVAPPDGSGAQRGKSTWWSGPTIAAGLLAVLAVAGGAAAWALTHPSNSKPIAPATTSTSTTTTPSTTTTTTTPAKTTTTSTSKTATTSTRSTTLTQALALLPVLQKLNRVGTTKGLLPPSSCRKQSADLVTCTDPNSVINTVSFHTFPNLTALYGAYVSAATSVTRPPLRINHDDCTRQQTSGEVSWNHDSKHLHRFSLVQARSGMLDPSTQAAGRVFCTITDQGLYYIVWTQDAGAMLGILSGGPHVDAWHWWHTIHHSIQLTSSKMSMG